MLPPRGAPALSLPPAPMRRVNQILPHHIREFRGTLEGRANRAIFLATATFSVEAQRDAAREGAKPVELVDLEALISLLIELRLGVTTKTACEVDRKFLKNI
jgi:restriction system protein